MASEAHHRVVTVRQQYNTNIAFIFTKQNILGESRVQSNSSTIFVAGLSHYIRENWQPPNFIVQLRWVKLAEEQRPPSQTPSAETYPYGSDRVIMYIIILWHGFSVSDDTFPSYPKGYRQSQTRDYPVLRGQNFCRYCLCSPCVIDLPPDFLCGYCSPHPANDEKQHSNNALWDDFSPIVNGSPGLFHLEVLVISPYTKSVEECPEQAI